MNWKNMPVSHKIATVIAFIAAAVWLLQTLDSSLFPMDMAYPAIAVFTVCEAVVHWKNKRTWAYLLIAGAVISMACFILELCLLA